MGSVQLEATLSPGFKVPPLETAQARSAVCPTHSAWLASRCQSSLVLHARTTCCPVAYCPVALLTNSCLHQSLSRGQNEIFISLNAICE